MVFRVGVSGLLGLRAFQVKWLGFSAWGPCCGCIEAIHTGKCTGSTSH